MILFLLSLSTTFYGPFDEQAPASTLSKEQIIVGIEHRHALMNSSRYKFSYVLTPAPGRTLGNLIAEGVVTSVRVGDRYLVEATSPPQDGGTFVRATDTKITTTHNVAAGSININAGVDPTIYRYDSLNYLLGIPISPEDRMWVSPGGIIPPTEIDKHKGLLPATIADPLYVVAAHQEQVDGAWCHLIESSVPQPIAFRFWVDPLCDFAIRRREHVTGPQVVLRRSHLKGWKKIGATWFPTQVLDEKFAIAANKAIGSTDLLHTSKISVSDIAIGNVKPQDAEIKLLPGMLIQDSIKNEITMVPGLPDDRFLKTMQKAREQMGDYMKPVNLNRPTPKDRSSNIKFLLLGNLVAFLCLSISWFARRTIQNRKKQT